VKNPLPICYRRDEICYQSIDRSRQSIDSVAQSTDNRPIFRGNRPMLPPPLAFPLALSRLSLRVLRPFAAIFFSFQLSEFQLFPL
jgi:hypothetical protein